MSVHKAINGKVYCFDDKYDFLPSVPGSVAYCELSADTEPAVIRARHRQEVEDEFLRDQDATAAQISSRLCLPLWNVKRALAEIQDAVPTATDEREAYREANSAVVKAVFDLLAAGGSYFICEIVERTGHSQTAVSRVMRRHWTKFTAIPRGMRRGKYVRYVYSLKPVTLPESAASGERNARSVV